MPNFTRVNRQFRKQIHRDVKKIIQPKPVVMRGVVGNGDGSTVYVSGTNRYIWIRVNGVKMSVFNNRITPVYDLPVLVGYDDINPQLLQVLGFDYGAQADIFPTNIPLHGETHRHFSPYGGNDITWIELRQFLPLSVSVTGMDLTVYPGSVSTGSGWIALGSTVVDLTSYIPGSNQLYALIYMDPGGVVSVLAGTAAASVDITDVPPLPDGCIAICAVKLYAGQTAIADLDTGSDIIDLRFPGLPSSGPSYHRHFMLMGG